MTSLYITESGAYIRKTGGVISIGRNNEVLMEVPLERVEDILLVNTVQVSSALITELLTRNIPLSWISGTGKFYGTLMSTESVDIMKHSKQFYLLEEKELYLRLSRKIIKAKTHNQLTVLRRYLRSKPVAKLESSIKNIIAISKHIDITDSYQELMGYEGYISRLYFEAIGAILPDPFSFTRRTKQPPKDPVNSMLSLGYTMLFNEMLSNIVATGLHPYVGCLHRIAKGHPALVSDLIEEWRAPIVDSMVLALVRKNMITYDMFEITDEGCFLNPEARRIFLQSYNKKIQSNNQYLDDKYTYRESLKRQCKKYASAIMQEDDSVYIPLELR